MFIKKKPFALYVVQNTTQPQAPCSKKQKIPKFEDIYKIQVCQFMFKLSYQLLPAPLQNIMNKNKSIHSHDTRHSKDFNVPNYKNIVVRQSLLVTGPNLWMNSPQTLKGISYKRFCRKIKLYYVASY